MEVKLLCYYRPDQKTDIHSIQSAGLITEPMTAEPFISNNWSQAENQHSTSKLQAMKMLDETKNIARS
jgi:hypothetical protein